MKNKLLKLISILFTLPLCAIDIIQLDVGNSLTLRGTLNVTANETVDPSGHGTQMTLALLDELITIKSKNVNMKQLVWSRYGSPLKVMEEAILEHPSVLSLSFGGIRFDSKEELLLLKHASNDTVIVAAAGNEYGGTHYFPANYPNPCILSVGTLHNGKRASYSNHGKVWLEQRAIDPNGTSASTARMAGIVLQIRRNHPKLNCSEVVVHARMLYGK